MIPQPGEAVRIARHGLGGWSIRTGMGGSRVRSTGFAAAFVE